jgi:hypothetical protein
MAAPAKNYDMTVHPTAGLVRSQSDGARAHQVTLPSCDCADYINRKGDLVQVDGLTAITLCKHIVEFLERVGGWNRPAGPPSPEVYENLSRQRARTLMAEALLADSMITHLLDIVIVDGNPVTCPGAPKHPEVKLAAVRFAAGLRYTVTITRRARAV